MYTNAVNFTLTRGSWFQCLMANSFVSCSICLSCFFFVHKGTQLEIHEAHLLEDVIDRFQVSIYL